MAERERPVRVDPRLAATVLLLRDHEGGIEVFMVVRHQQIDFASGALVFPGGSVDEGDRSLAWHSAQDVAGTAALALRITAVRETFEESGILLARRHGADQFISDQDIADLQRRYRPSLLAGNITFESIVAAENLTLAIDCLTPFSHWITPVGMPKRFDTHFFLARAPTNHFGNHDGSETVASLWLTPRRALDGGFRTVVPTRLNLDRLAQHRRVDDAIDAARAAPIFTVLPELFLSNKKDGRSSVRIPAETGYSGVIFEV